MGIYNRQRIRAGNHFTRLRDRYFLPVRNKNFVLKGFMYGPGLRYDYGNSDNLDWNKYAGIQLDKYNPHGRTIMVVFRYNSNLDAMEWGLYYHNIKSGLGEYREVGSVPGLIDENNTMYTGVGSVPSWEVRFVNNQQIKVELKYNGYFVGDLVTFKKFGNYHTRANFYWGGNMPAQDDVEAAKKYTLLDSFSR